MPFPGHTVRHSPVNCSETGQGGKVWDLNQNNLSVCGVPEDVAKPRQGSAETWGHLSGSFSDLSEIAEPQTAPGWAVKVLLEKAVQTPVLRAKFQQVHIGKGVELELELELGPHVRNQATGGRLSSRKRGPNGCDIQNIESPARPGSLQSGP